MSKLGSILVFLLGYYGDSIGRMILQILLWIDPDIFSLLVVIVCYVFLERAAGRTKKC